jgi:hypothetical protein
MGLWMILGYGKNRKTTLIKGKRIAKYVWFLFHTVMDYKGKEEWR